MLSKRAIGLDLIPSTQGNQGGQSEYDQRHQHKNRYVGIGVKDWTDYPSTQQWDTRVPRRQQVPDLPIMQEDLPKLSKRKL